MPVTSHNEIWKLLRSLPKTTDVHHTKSYKLLHQGQTIIHQLLDEVEELEKQIKNYEDNYISLDALEDRRGGTVDWKKIQESYERYLKNKEQSDE